MRNRAARGTVRPNPGRRGMTLIEILIALIVMVLGVLGIMALFPPSLQMASESMEETNAAMLAESVAHSLAEAFSAAEEDKQSPKLQLRCTMSHDMKAGDKTRGRYSFILPPLPTNPLTNPEWVHYPGSATPGGQAGVGGGDPGSKMVNMSWDPEADDRHFQLGGDQWTVDAVQSVHEVNDPTDPLTQFAFSFDIRKVDDMWYQRRNSGAIDPYRGTVLKPDDYEAMMKLYEVRIHILRIAHQGGANGAEGAVARRYITTVTKRISVR
ncbi:MAG: prepilin-type N-terminal cleavage/methylation domain-containing protein [Planctomycetaceae bacterium]|nr:prepilin-type N-terminal cleavage/methylation domain-containing protein [Planctomycetaceae bacterium]